MNLNTVLNNVLQSFEKQNQYNLVERKEGDHYSFTDLSYLINTYIYSTGYYTAHKITLFAIKFKNESLTSV